MKTAGDMFLFLLTVFRKTPKMSLMSFFSITGRVVWESLPVVLIFGSAIGISMGFEFLLALKIVGAESLSPYFTVMSVLKEIGPMIAGAQVLMRSGTRITSEIASMKDRGLLTAIEVFPVDSFSFVAVPRFWAIALSTLIFSPIASLIAILSSAFLIVEVFGVSYGAFWEGFEKGGTLYDIYVGFVKCGVIGVSNALFSTYYGWNAKEGAKGVSEAVQKSVALAVVIAIVINYTLSIAFYG